MPSEYMIIKECEYIAEKMIEEELIESKRLKPTIKVDRQTGIFKAMHQKFKEHLQSLDKEQTVSVAKIASMNDRGTMPVMIKHCVVAVQPKLKSEGELESFIGAHNICFWSFDFHGLLNARTGKPTSRGLIRERYHKSDKDRKRNGLSGRQKVERYNKTFNKLFKNTELPLVIYKAIHP